MLNTKSSLTASAPYFQSSQNIFPTYPRISASSENFYLPTADVAAFPTNPGFLPFAPRTEGHAFPAGLVGAGLAGDAAAVEAWRGMPTGPAAGCWPYDSIHSFHYAPSYGGLDVRRKNATRESTSTLKAWLYEHIKNPYPTKGEKIMLAIITKMTLTQVSTWFANARRRLKKENKMQWSPRNRTGEEDDDDDDDDKMSVDRRQEDDDHVIVGGANDAGEGDDDDDDDDEIIVDTDQPAFIPFPINVMPSPYLPSKIFDHAPPRNKSPKPRRSASSSPQPPPPSAVSPAPPKEKPRIWSLADVATSGLERNSDTCENSKAAIVKSTLQSLTEDEEEQQQQHRRQRDVAASAYHQHPQPHPQQPHRTDCEGAGSTRPMYNPLGTIHRYHGISGSQLSHLQNLYRSHQLLARTNFCKDEEKVAGGRRRMSPRSDESVDSTSSNKNFDSKQLLYKNGSTITVPSKIR